MLEYLLGKEVIWRDGVGFYCSRFALLKSHVNFLMELKELTIWQGVSLGKLSITAFDAGHAGHCINSNPCARRKVSNWATAWRSTRLKWTVLALIACLVETHFGVSFSNSHHHGHWSRRIGDNSNSRRIFNWDKTYIVSLMVIWTVT